MCGSSVGELGGGVYVAVREGGQWQGRAADFLWMRDGRETVYARKKQTGAF